MLSPNLSSSQSLYKIRLHAVVTGNDGSTGGGITPTFNNQLSLSSLINKIEDANRIFKPADIIFEFDPKVDFTEIHSALLNEDAPFKNGKIVPPPYEPNPNKEARVEFAENLLGSLVVYFRDFDKKKYTYKDENGVEKIDWAANYSGSDGLFVRVVKDVDKLSHEIGHYLHLDHTFSDNHTPLSVKEAAKMIKDVVESGKFTKEDAALVFDGDRGTVGDTPPDPRGAVMGEINANADPCGPKDTAVITVNFSDGSKDYSIKPDRMNAMSYYTRCQTASTTRFSRDQINRMRKAIGQGNRKLLIENPSGLYYAVWRRGSDTDERMVYQWKYKFFRMKYDELWNQGWRLAILDNRVDDGTVLYTAVWRKSSDPEIQVYSWKYDDYRKKYDELWNQGWRLHILNNYVVNGEVRYTAVWRKSTAGEIQVYGWSYEDYRKKYDELWNQGWRLHILNNYAINNQVRYTAVWRKSSDPEIQVYSWKYDDYRKKYDELWNQGWRLHILNNYVVNGEVRYTAVWRKGTHPEVQLYGWKYRPLREKSEELWNQGMRLAILNVI